MTLTEFIAHLERIAKSSEMANANVLSPDDGHLVYAWTDRGERIQANGAKVKVFPPRVYVG